MNNRLQQFLAAENISQSQFADIIGVARASVSHILAGRNKPGFDFIESMSRHFPTLNVEWLILGTGKMYKSAPDAAPAPISELFSPVENDLFTEDKPAAPAPAISEPTTPKAPLSPAPDPQITERNTLRNRVQQTKNQRNITRIIVFYDDNTFQELK